MFVFSTDENMKSFISDPKKYLSSPPKMPRTQRLLMTGPRGIGVHTQASRLSKLYNLKVVDYQQLVKTRLSQILKLDHRLPNNIIPGLSMVSLSESELEEIKSGKPFPSWKFIPWILDYLGYELQKRSPPPIPEGDDQPELELSEEDLLNKAKELKKKALEDAKRAKEEEEQKRAKEERAKRRNEAKANG